MLWVVRLVGVLVIVSLGYSCSDLLDPGTPDELKKESTRNESPSSYPEKIVDTGETTSRPEQQIKPRPDGQTNEQRFNDQVPRPDQEVVKPYAYQKPNMASVPKVLQSDTWLTHFRNDILPYWMTTEAKGTPVGNFPTERQMDGKLTGNTDRRPRMLGRQSFMYAMGYLMTGDPALLQLAQKGCDWLLSKAQDTTRGGWYELLDKNGTPKGKGPKWAQDMSYSTMGPAACYFITRNKTYEQAVLRTRDLLFDSNTFWSPKQLRIKDGYNYEMTQPQDYGNDGGWELVAQLDPINAFMLLVQPVLHDKQRREQFVTDMFNLADGMVMNFNLGGIFWGVQNKLGQYGSRHADFGHNLKAYWMVLQVDKRIQRHPFMKYLPKHMYQWVDTAYDKQYGSWGEKMLSKTQVKYGSSWWIFAEANQFTATLNFIDQRYTSRLEKTAQFWLKHYVDQKNKGIYDGVKRDGSGWGWPTSSNSKCNQWKNGFHATEHALIMYIHGKYLEGKLLSLYFAVPTNEVQTFIAKPYIFEGKEIKREDLGDIGGGLRKVRVTFTGIY